MTDEEKKKDQIDKKIIEDQKNPMEQKKIKEQKNKKSDSLEDKSLEELHKQIEKGKRKASRSIVFAIAAIIAIIAIGVAWFVSNTRVSAIGARISADNPVSFELGSAGQRQSAEEKYLVDDSGNNVLNGGTEENFSKYIDTKTGKEDDSSVSLQIGTSDLAWYLNGQESLIPGASGKFEFYLIPRQEGLTSAKINLNMEGYTKPVTANSKVEKNSVDKLQKLLSGHVLLFQNLDDTKGYSGWIEPTDTQSNGNYTITVNAPSEKSAGSTDQTTNTGVFEKDVPYKVTLYWVWPKYFRNYVYTQRSTQGDLFTDAVSDEEYKRINNFLNAQKTVADSRLFYELPGADPSTGSGNSGTIDGNIGKEMSDAVLDICNTYYNQADEYIGKNIGYIHIELTATASSESSENGR